MKQKITCWILVSLFLIFTQVIITCLADTDCQGYSGCGKYASCSNSSSGYITCTCPSGNFNKDSNSSVCDDINECFVYTAGTLCPPRTQCLNTIGSYLCGCLPGYSMVGNLTNATTCIDIDECSNTNICPTNSSCRNTIGSYVCTCNSGFYNIGIYGNTVCEVLDPCSKATLNNCNKDTQDCISNGQNFTCTCKKGYQAISGGLCSDINECTVYPPTHINYPCDRNPAIQYYFYGGHTCINSPGSYYCICPPGYRLDVPTKTCKAINYCADGNFTCSKKSTCTYENIPGRYKCYCNSNYLNGDELISPCIDLDECALKKDNCDRVNGFCNNTDGSFSCGCNQGFYQDPSSLKCIDIDECFNGKACDLRYSICINTVGSFTCNCKPGYEKIPNTLSPTCRDVNECCPVNNCYSDSSVVATCTNSVGSFGCKCPPGFWGNGYPLNVTLPYNGTGCNDIDECFNSPCLDTQQCINTPGSFMCLCKPGFYLEKKLKLCLDKNECHTKNICGDTTCVNTVGSYVCECPESSIGINLNGVIKCQDYLSWSSEQMLVGGKKAATITVLKKTFTINFKVKISSYFNGNIIKITDNSGNYIDVSVKGSNMLFYVFGNQAMANITLNQWLSVAISQFNGSFYISFNQFNVAKFDSTFNGPNDYANMNIIMSDPAANGSISELKIANGDASIWGKWQMQSRCQPECGNGTATFVRTCNSPACLFMNQSKTEFCFIMNCNQGFPVLKDGSCNGFVDFKNNLDFTLFYQTFKLVDVQMILEYVKKFSAVQLPFVCNDTFNRNILDDINAAYNYSADGLSSLLNVKNILRNYISCQPNVLKNLPGSSLIMAMFEKYDNIVERYFAVSNLFTVIKNKQREVKQKVDMCSKQGLVNILHDNANANKYNNIMLSSS
ncbi:fibrillin-3 isoform X1 [Hydra vulgaris]|uniref:fibrillin-3 isoform X1 n=1 Tax=Hydra vulgaris TaxID=6087 RepID=UPI001F5E4555|nr:fibrillin-3 [Hydra vulgaris]